jgi:hypothetical protein
VELRRWDLEAPLARPKPGLDLDEPYLLDAIVLQDVADDLG